MGQILDKVTQLRGEGIADGDILIALSRRYEDAFDFDGATVAQIPVDAMAEAIDTKMESMPLPAQVEQEVEPSVQPEENIESSTLEESVAQGGLDLTRTGEITEEQALTIDDVKAMFGEEKVVQALTSGISEADMITVAKRKQEQDAVATPEPTVSGTTKYTDSVKEKHPKIYTAIKDAYDQVGDTGVVDFHSMLNLIEVESGFKAGAKNTESSATGLGQFITGTWNDMVNKYGEEYGITKDDRTDPKKSAIMTVLFNLENASALEANGLPVTPENIYMLHFSGANAGIKALNADDTTQSSEVYGNDAIEANESILKGKTISEVKKYISDRIGVKDTTSTSSQVAPSPIATGDNWVQEATARYEEAQRIKAAPKRSFGDYVNGLVNGVGREFDAVLGKGGETFTGAEGETEALVRKAASNIMSKQNVSNKDVENASLKLAEDLARKDSVSDDLAKGKYPLEDRIDEYTKRANELRQSGDSAKDWFTRQYQTMSLLDDMQRDIGISAKLGNKDELVVIAKLHNALIDEVSRASDSDTWYKAVGGGVTGMLPFMGKRALAGVTTGGTGAFTASADQGTGDVLTELLRDNVDITNDGVINAASVAGLAYGGVELLQLGQWGKLISKMAGKGAKGAVKKGFKELLKNVVKNASTQTFEEGVQRIATETGEEIARVADNKQDEIDGKQIFNSFVEEMVAAAPTMLATSAIGAGGGAILNKGRGNKTADPKSIAPSILEKDIVIDEEVEQDIREEQQAEKQTVHEAPTVGAAEAEFEKQGLVGTDEITQEDKNALLMASNEELEKFANESEEGELKDIAVKELLDRGNEGFVVEKEDGDAPLASTEKQEASVTAKPIEEVASEAKEPTIASKPLEPTLEEVDQKLTEAKETGSPVAEVYAQVKEKMLHRQHMENLLDRPVTMAEADEDWVTKNDKARASLTELFREKRDGEQIITKPEQEVASKGGSQELSEDKIATLLTNIDDTLNESGKSARNVVNELGDLLGVNTSGLFVFSDENVDDAISLLGLDSRAGTRTRIKTKNAIKNPIVFGQLINNKKTGVQGLYLSKEILSSTNPKLLGTIAHEFGHHVMNEKLKSSSTQVQDQVEKAYQEFFSKAGRGTIGEYAKLTNIPGMDRVVKGSESTKVADHSQRDYMLKKNEWMADNIGRAMLKNKRPSNVVEKFFYDAVQAFKQLIAKLTKSESEADQAVQAFVDGLIAKRDFELGRDETGELITEEAQVEPSDVATKEIKGKEEKEEKKTKKTNKKEKSLDNPLKKEINKERKEEEKKEKGKTEKTDDIDIILDSIIKSNDIDVLLDIDTKGNKKLEKALDDRITEVQRPELLDKVSKARPFVLERMKDTETDQEVLDAIDDRLEVLESSTGIDAIILGTLSKIDQFVENNDIDLAIQSKSHMSRWKKTNVRLWLTEVVGVPELAVEELSVSDIKNFKKALAPYYGVRGMNLAENVFGKDHKRLEKSLFERPILGDVSQLKYDLIEKLINKDDVDAVDYDGEKFVGKWIKNGLVDVTENGKLVHGKNPKSNVRQLTDIAGDLESGESGKSVTSEDSEFLMDKRYDEISNSEEDDYFEYESPWSVMFMKDLSGELLTSQRAGSRLTVSETNASPSMVKGLKTALKYVGDILGIHSIEDIVAQSNLEGDINTTIFDAIKDQLMTYDLDQLKDAKSTREFMDGIILFDKGVNEVVKTTVVDDSFRNFARGKLAKLSKGNQLTDLQVDQINEILSAMNGKTTANMALHRGSPLQVFANNLSTVREVDDFTSEVGKFSFAAVLSPEERANVYRSVINKFGNSDGISTEKMGATTIIDYFGEQFADNVNYITRKTTAPVGVMGKAKKFLKQTFDGFKGVSYIDPLIRKELDAAFLGQSEINRELTSGEKVIRDPKKYSRKYDFEEKTIKSSVREAMRTAIMLEDMANVKDLSKSDAQALFIDGAIRWLETADLRKHMFRTVKNINKVGDAHWEHALDVLAGAVERKQKSSMLNEAQNLMTKLNMDTITEEARLELEQITDKYDLHKMKGETSDWLKTLEHRLMSGDNRMTPIERNRYLKAVSRLTKTPLAEIPISELREVTDRLEDIIAGDIKKRKEIKAFGRTRAEHIEETTKTAVHLVKSDNNVTDEVTDEEVLKRGARWMGAVSRKVKRLQNADLNLEYYFDMSGTGGATLSDLMLKPLWDANEEKLGIIQSDTEELNTIMKEKGVSFEGFSENQYSGLAGIVKSSDINWQQVKLENGQNLILSPSELVHVIRSVRDEDGYRHITRGGLERWEKNELVRKFKITEKDVSTILKSAPRDLFNLAIGLDEFVEGHGQRLDALSVERTGRKVTDGNPQHESLSVAHRDSNKDAKISDYNSINDLVKGYTRMSTKLKERTANATGPLVIEGVDESMARMIHDGAIFAAYGERANQVEFAKNKAVDEMTRNHLPEVADKTKAYIEGELNAGFTTNPVDNLMRGARGLWTVGKLGNRIQTALLQPLSGPLYAHVADNWGRVTRSVPSVAAKVSRDYIASGFKAKEAFSEMFEKSAIVRDRADTGYLPDATQGRFAVTSGKILNGLIDKDVKDVLLEKVRPSTGLWMINIMDIAGIAQGWELAKIDVEASGKFEIGTEEYWKDVVEKHNRFIRKTQPTFNNLDKNEIQRAEGLKQFINFASFRAKAWQIMRESLHNINKGDRVKGVQQLITFTLMTASVTLLKTAGEAALGAIPEPEELALNFTRDVIGNLPFGGGLINAATGGWSKDIWWSKSVDAVNDLREGIIEEDMLQVGDALITLSAHLGIGLDAIRDQIEDLMEIAEGVTDGN